MDAARQKGRNLHDSSRSPSASIFGPLQYHIEMFLDAVSARRRGLRRLRSKWGKAGERDGSLSNRYFELTRDTAPAGAVDDKTWVDLEFPRIFAEMDSTETPLGSQFLFRQLRFYLQSPAELAAHVAACEILRKDAGLREEIQLRLGNLDAESNGYLANFIFGKPPAADGFLRMLPWWSLACLATLVAVLAFALPVQAWLATVVINFLFIVRLSPNLSREVDSLRACNLMLGTASHLASIRPGASLPPQLARMSLEAPARDRARKALGSMSLLQAPLIQPIAIWLNLFFLVDLAAYANSARRMAGVRAELASVFDAIGSLDAAIAVASFMERHPQRCQPEVSAQQVLDIVDGNHPLVRRTVPNSIRLDGRSALVTGSNMAGKTTFIKMVGINLILGRTLGFCLAKEATLPNSPVMASIRGEHSVESGKSHYFAEMEAIQGFMESAKQGRCKLFLIDELFNGTNTVERLAAGRAVLESLGGQGQVLVTTHDVELQDDIAGLYDLYYFQEDPDVEGFFDYRLRPGRTTRRNAIRLLQRNGFPGEVVERAMQYSERYAGLSRR